MRLLKRKYDYLLKDSPGRGSSNHLFWIDSHHNISKKREVENIFGGKETCECILCIFNRRYAKYVTSEDNGRFTEKSTGNPIQPFRDWIEEQGTYEKRFVLRVDYDPKYSGAMHEERR